MDSSLLAVILSASDIGSAAAHALKRAGLHPVLVESPAPAATRRRMAFAGAVHAGRAELEGLEALRCAGPGEALAARERPGVIPLLPSAGLEVPPDWRLDVLVDARMRKRERGPRLIGRAALTVGIGPGFRAGEQVDAVIESNWGPRLGAVLWEGGAEEYTGQHRQIEGFGNERYLYAPRGGRFRTALDVGAPVRPGDIVGTVAGVPLAAMIGGVLRGLAYDGLEVGEGAKLAEIDPTGDPANCTGIAHRPARIAQGVVEAVRTRWPEKAGGQGA